MGLAVRCHPPDRRSMPRACFLSQPRCAAKAAAAVTLAYATAEALPTLGSFVTDWGRMRIDSWIVWALILSPRPSDVPPV